jgi:endogenous inhibitor of DNA gyrase (YacG/DUF329 family)
MKRKITITCPICKKKFLKKTITSTYCSPKCARTQWRGNGISTN